MDHGTKLKKGYFLEDFCVNCGPGTLAKPSAACCICPLDARERPSSGLWLPRPRVSHSRQPPLVGRGLIPKMTGGCSNGIFKTAPKRNAMAGLASTLASVLHLGSVGVVLGHVASVMYAWLGVALVGPCCGLLLLPSSCGRRGLNHMHLESFVDPCSPSTLRQSSRKISGKMLVF